MKRVSDHKNQQKKKIMGVASLLPTFPPHEHGHFWPFFTIQSQGIEQTKTLLFILKVLWWSNNMMQKSENETFLHHTNILMNSSPYQRMS
jgi:hypothetical protein